MLEVLEWVCPAFKQEIRSVYENFVCEQNIQRKNLEESKEYHGELDPLGLAALDSMSNIAFSEPSEEPETALETRMEWLQTRCDEIEELTQNLMLENREALLSELFKHMKEMKTIQK